MPTGGATIRAVIFDLDDTLYPERQYVRSGYRAVAEFLRMHVGEQKQLAEWLWARFQEGRSARAFDAMNEHFRLGLSTAQITQLVSVYREHSPQIAPRDGVVELLDELHRDRKLGLLSDGFMPAQRLKFEALNIEGFFDAVIFTEEIGRHAWKPSPRGFEEIARQLATAPDQCAYVGDNPAKDFVGPNRLGWRTIQYRCPGQVHAHNPPADDGAPQVVVSNLDEICEALG